MKNIYLAILLLSVVCASCTDKTAKNPTTPRQFNYSFNPEDVGTTPEKIAVMDSLLQSMIDEGKTYTLAAFVAKGGNVVYHKAFGWKDPEKRIPASVDDYYVKFSQTKAITTVAFMTLVEKGFVAIDDPVSGYFPEIPSEVLVSVNEDGTYETRPVASPMTFEHLMAHTSGVMPGEVGKVRWSQIEQNRAAGNNSEGKAPKAQYSEPNTEADYLEENVLETLKYPLGFDPGSDWNYHPSSNVLAYMIEHISGMPLREYVKKSVLEPLGMDDTDWFYGPEAYDRFVKPYKLENGVLEPVTTMYIEGAVSPVQTYCEGGMGLNGPIGDYAKFCQMLLNKGEYNGHRILKPETVELMSTLNCLPEMNAGGENFRFGLGFELYNEHRKPVPEVSNTAYSWGGMMGTKYIIDPENDLITLFYVNMFNGDGIYPSFLSAAYQLFE